MSHTPTPSPKPPHWVDKFLEQFCAPELREEVMGDLHERYYLRVKQLGEKQARRLYLRDGLSYLRPSVFTRKTPPFPNPTLPDMLRNYFIIAFRNLRLNRLYSLLNITGLAVGLAFGIIVLLWVAGEFSYNQFHRNLDSIYLMMQHQTNGGDVSTSESVPSPLAVHLRTHIPEVEYAARATGAGSHLFQWGDKSLYQSAMYTDPDFFRFMTFPAVAGDPVAALREPGSVVMTESAARKLFGTEDPVGKVIRHNNMHDLKVAVVLHDLPSNSTINFEVVLPFLLHEQEYGIGKWDNNSFLTWVKLQPRTNLDGLNRKLSNIVASHLVGEHPVLFAFPFADAPLYSSFRNGKHNPSGGRIEQVRLLCLLGLFMVLIACINFMNLATARSAGRAKEVGVRKVVGAPRRTIILQFLSEALVMTFLALVLSVGLVKLLLSGLNQVTGKGLQLDFSNWQHWSGLLLLGLFTGVVAGTYPAFFLSAFKPVRVLKGTISPGKSSGMLRKGLVTFQFFISVCLIISTIVIVKQLQHAQSRPMGYDLEHLIQIPARGEMGKTYKAVKNELLQIPGVTSVSAGNDDLLHFGAGTSDLKWKGQTADQNYSFTLAYVQYDWTRTTGLKMAEGRDFSPQFGSDTLACLLNQAAVKRMGLKEPVGAVIRYGAPFTVIGVVEDFVYNSPIAMPRPMIVFLSRNHSSNFFVRIQNDENWQQTLARLEEVVKKHNPAYPFEFHFVKDEYEKGFTGIRSMSRLLWVCGSLAIFISCLGLFGLSAFVAERRTREIGIRKVLGATMADVWFLLSREFFKPVLLAFLLGAPLAGWAMQQLLENIEYRIELAWWMFALTGILIVLIALLTVSVQGIKTAMMNPVKSLRNE